MERHLRWDLAIPVTLGIVFILTTASRADDVEQHLRDQYRGRILVLRGFYSGEQLRYDSSGAPSSAGKIGDWTTDGLVQINEIQSSQQVLKIKAKRLVIISAAGRGFQFASEEALKKDKKTKKAALVEIEAALGTEHVTEEMVNAVLWRIFVGPQEQLADLVPNFWKPCLEEGGSGKNDACRFSSEIAAVPGMQVANRTTTPSAEMQASMVSPPPPNTSATSFKVGHGVSPPKVLSQQEPSFTEFARKAKYQGMVTLALIVDKDGLPKNIHITSPLGAGLDAKAVQAVERWKFRPAQKDGQPVAVQIAVEIDFHLY